MGSFLQMHNYGLRQLFELLNSCCPGTSVPSVMPTDRELKSRRQHLKPGLRPRQRELLEGKNILPEEGSKD